MNKPDKRFACLNAFKPEQDKIVKLLEEMLEYAKGEPWHEVNWATVGSYSAAHAELVQAACSIGLLDADEMGL